MYLYVGRAVVYAQAHHEVLNCAAKVHVAQPSSQLPCQQAMDTLLELVERGHLPDRPVAAYTFHAVQLCCRHAVSCMTTNKANSTGNQRIATVLLSKV